MVRGDIAKWSAYASVALTVVLSADPFAEAWPVVEGWLMSDPTTTAKELMDRLARIVPDVYASKEQLRTLQRRIKAWRAEKAKDLILGQLRNAIPEGSLCLTVAHPKP